MANNRQCSIYIFEKNIKLSTGKNLITILSVTVGLQVINFLNI